MKNNNILFRCISAISILVMISSFVHAGIILSNESHAERTDFINYGTSSEGDGWYAIDDGKKFPVVMNGAIVSEEPLTIYNDGISGKTIMFDNNRNGAVVSCDGKVIYEVNVTSLTKQLRFTDYNVVTIPEGTETVSITYSGAKDNTYLISDIIAGEADAIRYDIFFADWITMLLIAVLGVIGLALAAFGIFARSRNMRDLRVIELAVFIVIAILWGITDSYVPTIVQIPQEIVGLVCYFAILGLPIPISRFIKETLGNSTLTKWCTNLALVNIICTGILSLTGVVRLDYSFYTAHVLIVITVISALVEISEKRKTEHKADLDFLFIGVIFLSICTGIALVFYWLKGGAYYRILFLSGLLGFILMLLASLVWGYVEAVREKELAFSEVKIQQQLALYDGLTNLMNRRGFENKLREIEKYSEDRNPVLVMMDVNGLKMTNDVYGHAAGDDLIVSASNVIKKVYAENAQCFRIGGDEFVVIFDDYVEDISKYEYQMREEVEKHNADSLWKLSIATGVSYLNHISGKRLSISDWKQEADVNMYRNKVAMTNGSNRDSAQDFKEIIDCIITTLEAKDIYTASHSDRVRRISLCIGEKMGLSPVTLNELESAAHLHDIGKIGIPDIILIKPSALTDEEYRQMQEHTTIGAGILARARGMQEISEIVLHHHERWDGRGYPHKIAGEEIPLLSRIIAVADSIDAMTSKRVYRDCFPIDKCRHEIEVNSGKMYDPAIVKLTLECWTDIEAIVLTHPKNL